jgi:glucan-binding YG repeat protein
MKLKKTLVMVLAACMTVGTIASTAFAAEPVQQYEVADNSITPAANGDIAVLPDEFAWIPGSPIGEFAGYDANGTFFTGTLTELDTPYTGWLQYGDNWAYYKGGRLQRHWQSIDGNWYYFNSYGMMLQRGVAWIEDRLYYFDENGVCDTTPGWKLVPNFFYVFENDNAAIITPADGFAWFYLNQNGYIQTGWNYIDGTWHMCDKQTGRMLANEWYLGEGGYWYYFDEYTDMATGWMTVADPYQTNRTYFFNNSGVLQWGWLNYDGNWYYLNPKNAARVENSWAFIAGPEGTYWYLFDEDGVMQTGWQAVNTGEEVKVGEEKGPDGKPKDIMAPVYAWYYLTSWGAMMKDQQFINGVWYDFGDDGQLAWVWNGTQWVLPETQATNVLVPGQGSTIGDVPGKVEFAK